MPGRKRCNESANRGLFGLALAVFAWAIFSRGAEVQTSHVPAKPLVSQVDHILIGSEQAEEFFQLFSQKLQLPIVWPFGSYGTFSSGGVGFGNVNIELIRRGPSESRPRSGIVGVALDPNSLTEVLAELDAHKVEHSAPAPFYRKDQQGGQHLYWTSVQLPALPQPGTIFLVKYNFDEGGRRVRIQRELQNRDGGPLGIESVTELVIGVRDMPAALREWGVLLGPDQAGVWQIGSGPAIHLVPAQQDQLLLLRVKVKSLQAARTVLKSENLLGRDSEHEISFDPSRLSGADIRLVE